MDRDDMIDQIETNLPWFDDWELAAIYLYVTNGEAPSSTEIADAVEQMQEA